MPDPWESGCDDLSGTTTAGSKLPVLHMASGALIIKAGTVLLLLAPRERQVSTSC